MNEGADADGQLNTIYADWADTYDDDNDHKLGIVELLRVTKPGGLVCFTVNEGVWATGGFGEAIEAHSADGDWQVLEQCKQGYMVNEGVEAWYIVARKVGA